MIESTLSKINVFSSVEQYNTNKSKIGANELSLVPTTKDTVPTGFVIACAMSEIPTGYLLCNGGAVSRTTYATLYAKIGTTYGVGDGSTTFNLPNLTNRFIQGNATVGTVKSAGLPNITGEFRNAGTYGVTDATSSTGAFYAKDKLANGLSGNDGDEYSLGFDASKSSSIYGNSTTVQPPALTMRFYIKY